MKVWKGSSADSDAVRNALVEAHASLAFVKMKYDWDRPGEEVEFNRNEGMIWLHTEPMLYGLRSDKRFADLQRRVEQAAIRN